MEVFEKADILRQLTDSMMTSSTFPKDRNFRLSHSRIHKEQYHSLLYSCRIASKDMTFPIVDPIASQPNSEKPSS
jgi:hypothetical protein